MQLEDLLSQSELFQGLRESDIRKFAKIFTNLEFKRGQVIADQGGPGDSMFIIADGFVEVSIREDSIDNSDPATRSKVLVQLGKGQIIGEMALVDEGPRSATITAVSSPTVIHAIDRGDFEAFCSENPSLGYIVMRNIAADLSFKLRKQNLAMT